jgi:DNA (cytosine-5)-methyltransferase 1
MDYVNKTKEELVLICKDKQIKGYSGKKKDEIIKLITEGESKVIQSVTDIVANENTTTINTNTINTNTINTNTINTNTINTNTINTNTLKMIDLFAGTGAFTYAFEKTGKVDCVFSNDMVEPSKNIYDTNFSHKLTLKNLNDINVKDIPSHDILTGGFPCQPFSIAGKQEGFQDERSNVFWKILAIIDNHKPSFVILENVKNLVSHDDGKTFEIIKKQLTDRKYHICFKILNTAKITGIPQHRERIYIVCIKSKDIFDKFTLDFHDKPKQQISSLLEDSVDKKYYYTEKSSTWDLVKNNITKQNTVYQYRRVYVRENKSNECPTLTANMGTGGHNVPLVLDNNGIRKLTPRECFTFQGFPASYKLPKMSDASLYKLAGNAVSLPVVELIANRLISLAI